MLDSDSQAGSSLYFYGGRLWRGHGGPAFGSHAAQQESVVRRLGDGDANAGRRRLSRLSQVMADAQAEHDAAYPPTAAQLRARRRI
jgi:hypothetical protein